ncbi:hypothetical protein [Oligoflexus tunisiensis]|uniref:hypothetical protein n=1 Tax=Oligoflexus tunisiensis TaxID=708132 RepID=UPI00114D1759|nr:hypothetical protein [Oligoflexus tunisiensis]
MKKSLSVLTISLSLAACGDVQAEEGAAYELPNEDSVCQLAWEQNEALLEPADRMGNPFLMQASSNDWRYEVEHEGRRIHIMPARKLAFQVELDASQTASGQARIVDCEVPVAWKALDVTLSVAFDPQFQGNRQIMMINGKPFGHETKGGLYLRHHLVPTDPHDINLAWHVQAPALNRDAAIQWIRTELHIPAEQTVVLTQALEHLQGRGPMGIEAIAMTVGTDAIQHWAHLPAQAASLWPRLRFLPIGPATAESTVENAWKKAAILDLAALKLFDVAQKSLAPCTAVGSGPHPACRQIVDETLVRIFQDAQSRGTDLCVHLAWQGGSFSPYFVSTFCVDPAGNVSFQGTQPDATGSLIAAARAVQEG